jgi:tetratricopeptide (TPR) repeat protein
MIRLSIVMGVLAVVLGGFFLLYQLNRDQNTGLTDEQRLAAATEAFEEQDYPQVLRQLEIPLSQQANESALLENPEALRMYITAREAIRLPNRGHLTRIIAPLNALIKLDEDDLDARHQLLDTLLTLERNNEALALAERLTQAWPEDASFFRQLAEAQTRQSLISEAIASLQRSIEIEPLDVPTHVRLFDLLREQQGDLDAFVERAEQLHTDHRDDPRAKMILAVAFEAQGDGVQAGALLKQASELKPTSQSLVPLLVNWLDRLGLYADATRYVLDAAEPGIESPAGRLAIYRAFEAGAHEDIVERLQDSDAKRSNSDLVGMWARAHFELGQIEQAQKLVTLLEQRDSTIANTWANLLTLDILGAPAPGSVIDTIVAVLVSEDTSTITAMTIRHPYFLQRLGEAYLEALEPEAAYAAFSVAAANTDSWALPHRALAQTLLQMQQPAAAMLHGRDAWARDQHPDSLKWQVLAMARAVRPDDDDAVDRVMQVADQLAEGSPQAGEVLPALIDLLIAAKRRDAANQRLVAALNVSDDFEQATLEALAEAAVRHGLDAEDATIAQVTSRHGVTPRLALIQALKAERNGAGGSGEALLIKSMPDPPTAQWQRAMAAYLNRTRSDEHGPYLMGLADANSDDIAMQVAAMLANPPEQHRDFFDRAIERLRLQAGDYSMNWRLQRARVNMQEPAVDEALEETKALLEEVLPLTPVHTDIRLVLSLCHLMLGEYDEAVAVAQQAKAIDDNNPQALLLHGKALHRLKRFQDARLDLLRLANSTSIDPDVRIEACFLLYDQGERSVVKQALVSMRTNDQIDQPGLLLLAKIHKSEGDLEKTDEIAQALLLGDPSADAIRFVTRFYRETNRPELADRVIAGTDSSRLSASERLMLKAEDTALQGEKAEASRLIEEAIELDPEQPKVWTNAIRLALSISQPAEAVRFAQRAIAFLPEDQGLRSLVEHADLLSQTADDASTIPMAVAIFESDRFREAAVSALRITASETSPDQEAEALADLASRYEGFKHLNELAGDRLLSVNKDEGAFSLASEAMLRFPDSAALARVATLSAYRLNRWTVLLSSAEAWAERNPQDRFRADLMRAAAMNQLNRFTTSIQVLAPYVSAMRDSGDFDLLLFDLYTRALVLNGQAEGAWQLLEPYLATSAQARGVALRRVNTDLADRLIASRWFDAVAKIDAESPDRFEQAKAAFISGQRLNDGSLIRRADRMLTEILSKPGPHGMDVYYAKGQIAQRLGRLDEATQAYRKVLAVNRDLPLVLNNLAVILKVNGGDDLIEAEQLSRRATELAPQDPNLIDTLALVLLAQGRHEEAQRTIDRAIRLDSSNPAWRLTKADIFEAMGEDDRAELLRDRYRPKEAN